MTSSTQIVFTRAVRHHVHEGFVSLLDRINEFEVGTVLIYNEKPYFWRRKELNFTGARLADLLSEAQKNDFSFNTESNVLFDETTDSSQRTVDIDLDLDGEMKLAFVDIGGDVGGSGKKIVKISVSLGSFNHIQSNMFEAVNAKSLAIDQNHPVVREAICKGKSMFVISSVYQAQKVEISVSREEDVSGKASEQEGESTTEGTTSTDGATSTGTTKTESGIEKAVDDIENVAKELSDKGVGIPKEDVKANVGAKTTGITVTKRETPSNVAFSVMKLDIGKNGSLTPRAEIGVSYHHQIHASFADAFANISHTEPASTTKPPSTSPSDSGAAASKTDETATDTPKEDTKDSSDAATN